jgi:2-methylisocitrate lyase-like PEP mutase family enzyme
MSEPATTLHQALGDPEIVVAPGVYDAFTALMAEQAGFRTLYLSGASIAYMRFGVPDIGLVGMNEVAGVLSAIRERISVPLIVDADTGYGNALNVMRTVRLFERLGASAIQIEDQTMPKRCGHLDGKELVPSGEMVGKIKMALESRESDDLLIIARTDAIASEGLDAALDRAMRYRDAGADVLFVEAPRSVAEMEKIVARLDGTVPLMANMVEGGKTPSLDARTLQDLGFSLVIFPGGLARALTHMATDYLASLKEHGSTAPFRNRMVPFDELNRILGTERLLQAGARFDEENFGDDTV